MGVKSFMTEKAKDLGYSLWYKMKKFLPIYAAFWGAAWSINQVAWSVAPQAAPAIFLGFNLISMPILCYYGAKCILAKTPAREKNKANEAELIQSKETKENVKGKVNTAEEENQQDAQGSAGIKEQHTLQGTKGAKRSISNRKVELIKDKRRMWLRNVRLLKVLNKRNTKEAA